MDIVARLIVMVALLLPGVGWAHGEVAKEPRVTYTCSDNRTGITAMAACAAGFQEFFDSWVLSAGLTKYWTTAPFCSEIQCSGVLWVDGRGNNPRNFSVSKTSASVCPTDSEAVQTKCFCAAGKKPKTTGTGCEDVGLCTAVVEALNSIRQPLKADAGPGTLTACYGGCKIEAGYGGTGSGGSYWLFPGYRATGENCQGGKASGDTIEPAPVACSAGLCPGSVNGTNVCLPCSKTDTKGPSETASAPAGQTPKIDGVEGATSKEQTVNCSNGLCEKVTTYRGPNGAVVKEEKKSEEQKSFCQQNPSLAICKDSAFAGGCSGSSGNFSCTGDAVQCALSREVHKRNCEWANVNQSLVQAGEAGMGGGSRPDGHPFANPDSGSLAFASVIDQTNRLGGGCPSDVAVSYGGRSWVIPWSQHCDKLQLIGNLMVAVCMLAAAMIVFRS